MNPLTPLHKIPLLPQDREYGFRFMHEVLDEALGYIEDRKKGKITSFVTPWPGLNNAGIGGLEWGSLLTIGARPGAGKTMIVSQLLREARLLNPTQDFTILEFQFEMGAKQYGSREFAAHMAMDYNRVLSTQKALDDFSIEKMKQLRDETRALANAGIIRGQFSKSLSYKGIEDAVRKYYALTGGKPMIVTIDHSWLIKGNQNQTDKFEILYQTAEMLMQLKNELPVIFIMLTQLNREIDKDTRKKPGDLGNYPTSGDIFGGDALQQASDMVIALNNPFKAGMEIYGPEYYKVKEDDIFMHLLKIRNAKLGKGVLFFKGEFERGKLVPAPEPQRATPASIGKGLKFPPKTSGFLNNSSVSADIGGEL